MKFSRMFLQGDWANILFQPELHVFTDASIQAYGASAYLVSGSETAFVMAKSRVAPVRELTIPKLGLLAATIGARLASHIKSSIEAAIHRPVKLNMWSDSQIVLGWLRSSDKKSIFIKNRCEEIRHLTGIESWTFCPSLDNPADLLTRGISLPNSKFGDLWLKGPSWLRDSSKTPDQPDIILTSADSVNLDFVRHTNYTESFNEIDITTYSSLSNLLNVTAYALKFVNNLKSRKDDRLLGSLTPSEIESAESFWIRDAQRKFFSDVLANLKTPHKRMQIITQLQLFLDSKGIIRCKGRVQNSDLDYESKRPVLIPKNSNLARLIVKQAHFSVHHFGVSYTVAKIRERFWIPQIHLYVKSCIRGCIVCKRIGGRSFKLPSPPPLPSCRVLESPPFYVCGLDNCGPFIINDGTKCYICLFTCTVTRAVHLELVPSNSSDDFLRAFRRFCARRSLPRRLISDNGSTFIGANNDLKRIFKSLHVSDFMSRKRVDWQFITKRAPWQGGFWERLIGLTKSALKKILGLTSVSFLEFSTIITEVECMLNDRPLTYVSSNFTDGEALTPSHLWCGRRLSSLPLL
ncbi:uncharacterized protein LOC141902118 [Tubulanus polymorphus]|uniref:uncharacterized protein LOC141902118 n=1 Tax=Tubulanus polymorphus TaxID=672921 RepID=UPI003DA28B42